MKRLKILSFICVSLWLLMSANLSWGEESQSGITKPHNTKTEPPMECPFTLTESNSDVIIAWVTNVREVSRFGSINDEKPIVVAPFRPVAILSGKELKETLGSAIRKDQPYWEALSPSSKPLKLTSVGSFLDCGECVYFGDIGQEKPALWTLLSSKPLPGVFRKPTSEEVELFSKLDTACVDQGDYLEEEMPPCSRPQLLAVTDINTNGMFEYWAADPYRWDMGLSVQEYRAGKLESILQVCVGCSD